MTAQTAQTPQTATPPTANPNTPSPVRASDAEREDAVARLHHALGEGRLDLAETEERVAAAYATRYRDELPALVADLPGPGSALIGDSSAPTWTDLWVGAVWRVRAALLGATDRPTGAHCRHAVLLTAAAVLWTIACAFLGAGLVH